MVKQDEVFQQVKEVFFFADTSQHSFQRYAPLLLLIQSFPLMEKFILTAQSTYFGFHAVGKDEKSIVVEQMWNSIQIVCIVVGISILHIHCALFQFHKQQGNSVDETHDICPAAVQIAVNLQLLDGQEVVVARLLKVDDLGPLFLGFAVRALDSDRNAVPNKGVLFLVDLHQGGGGQVRLHLLLRFVHLGRGEPRVQPLEGLPKIPGEQNFPVACPAKGAVPAQLFRVIGISHLPAQLPLQQVPGRFLNKNIFGVVVAHKITPLFWIINMVLKCHFVI